MSAYARNPEIIGFAKEPDFERVGRIAIRRYESPRWRVTPFGAA
jgi:hypothetical protein